MRYHKTNETSEYAMVIAMFYAAMQHELIEEHPSQTPESLIAEIGALVGMFLGCSALSIVHLGYFIIKWFYVTSQRCLSHVRKKSETPVFTVDKKNAIFQSQFNYRQDLSQSQNNLRHTIYLLHNLQERYH